MKRKRSREQALHGYHVQTKGGLERLLTDIAKAYVALYPRKARFFKSSLKKLNEVTVDNYKAGVHGAVEVRTRVPTELMLFIQSLVPEFGNDSEDMETLRKVWSDFAVGKDRRKRTRIIGGTDVKTIEQAEPPDREVACAHCGKCVRWSEAVGSGRPFCSAICFNAASD